MLYKIFLGGHIPKIKFQLNQLYKLPEGLEKKKEKHYSAFACKFKLALVFDISSPFSAIFELLPEIGDDEIKVDAII